MRYFVYFSSYLSFCTTNSENGSLRFRFLYLRCFAKLKKLRDSFFILTVRRNYKSG